MGNTLPIREKNAIDEIAFVVLFEKDLNDEALSGLKELATGLSAELPILEATNLVQVQVNPNNLSQPMTRENGFICSKKSSINSERMEWSFRVDSNRLIVACSEYTRWDDVSMKAKKILLSAVKKCDLAINPVVEVVCQCTDKFVLNESFGKYTIDEVFNKDSGYLTQHVVSKELDAWHIHQGWYWKAGSVNALNNLNINTRIQGNQSHETVISHLIKFRKNDDSAVTDADLFCGRDDKGGYLEDVMDHAHKMNKEVLLNLLSEDMTKTIGLKG